MLNPIRYSIGPSTQFNEDSPKGTIVKRKKKTDMKERKFFSIEPPLSFSCAIFDLQIASVQDHQHKIRAAIVKIKSFRGSKLLQKS
jgi:hypothetical protein